MSYPTEDPASDQDGPHSANFISAREYESDDIAAVSPREASSTVVTQAEVLCKRHLCQLSFLEDKQLVKISRTTKAGKQKVLLYVPIYVVLNIETAEERDARQTVRQANDDTTKEGFVVHNSGALEVACMGGCSPPSTTGGDTDPLLYTHLRGDTGVSMATTTSPGTSVTAVHSPNSSSNGDTYFIHYVRVAGRLKKSIHTLCFSPAPTAAADTAALVQRLIRAIYRGGVRHLMFFVSPKSGAGQGEKIFEKEVRPLLHFTRHAITTTITQRAHDCEDFCADLQNELSADYVVVGVGGDGMAHEIINGLHRRKLAILNRLRSTMEASSLGSSLRGDGDDYPTEGSSTTGPTSAQRELLTKLRVPPHWSVATLLQEGWCGVLPLVATLATGSACGLAKSLGVLTPAEGGLALVHLNTVCMDLMRMRFTANDDLVRYHEERLSARKRDKVKRKYAEFQQEYAHEDNSNNNNNNNNNNAGSAPAATGASPVKARHSDAREGLCLSPAPQSTSSGNDATNTTDDPNAAGSASPFRVDGSGRYSTAVAHHLGAPDMNERIAFMSLSFGMANDIDRGSEHLRWMGNSRFAVYGGYCLIRGVRKYQTTLRYLPWKSASTGKGLEKLHTSDTMPSTEELPICTMRTDCPHCRANQPAWAAERQAKLREQLARAVSGSQEPPDHIVDLLEMEGEDVTLGEMAQSLSCLSESELLNEETVDFSGTEEDGWVTISGLFYNILLCNLRDVAQDMNMAPRCHMSDGAIDIVFSRIMPGVTKGGGRKEFIQMMGALEKGEHVEHGFVNYIKARAVEIKVDAGISMSDGEMMPLSSVHLTKMRNAVRFVRSD